jgi:hypothetical protein
LDRDQVIPTKHLAKYLSLSYWYLKYTIKKKHNSNEIKIIMHKKSCITVDLNVYRDLLSQAKGIFMLKIESLLNKMFLPIKN